MLENDPMCDAEPKHERDSSKLTAGVFLASVGGLSALVGFGSALAASKRKDSASFSAGIAGAGGSPAATGTATAGALAESGAALAMRALAWGTAYAVGGVGLLCFAVWKLSGARDLKEFRTIMGNALPRIPKSESGGRTEFEGFTDLLQYVISESDNKKPKV